MLVYLIKLIQSVSLFCPDYSTTRVNAGVIVRADEDLYPLMTYFVLCVRSSTVYVVRCLILI